MQLIKLGSTTADPTAVNTGAAIEGWTSALWVERYRDAGEFKIEAPLSSGLVSFLPLGTLISHVETSEVMIVENHEISQPINEDPKLVITGRAFVTFLEERMIGDEWAETSNVVQEEAYPSDVTWDQAVGLIKLHLTDSAADDNELDNVEAYTSGIGLPVTIEARTFAFKDVYSTLVEVLAIDDFGVKTIRPTSSDPVMYLVVYRGQDISKTVRFSWMRGDLDNVDYFFSIKKLKTQAIVMGRWVQEVVNPTGATKYNRRSMIVDATDIDGQLTAYPSGGTLTSIIAKMQTRGRQALASQKNVSIVTADVSDNTNLRFRRDYQLGDLVTVDADFGAAAVMRVVEYAEAVDETGSSGHPTLAIPGED